MKRAMLVALLGFSMVQAGCSVLPGMRNDVDNGSAEPTVAIKPITPGLINELRAKDASARQLAVPAALQPMSAAASSYSYKIGPGDVLNIVVWDHPELTNPSGQQNDSASSGRLVGPDGAMFYPNVGVFQAAGKTTGEIRSMLAKELSRVIREPQVDVRVASYRSQRVYLTGEVTQPGVVFLDDVPKGVLDLINERGGFNANANRSRATLTRDGITYALDIDALYSNAKPEFNLMVQAGDLIHVGDVVDEKVFVMGEIDREGVVPMQRGRMTLTEALTTAGGVSAGTGNPKALFVFRGEPMGVDGNARPPSVFALDLTRADGLLLAESFQLKSRDVVYVASTDFAKYNRLISLMLPTITAIFQIDRLTLLDR